jgi:DNA-binding MarR family transcriptional regulator
MVDLLLTKVISSICSRQAGLTVHQWKVLAAVAIFGPLTAAEIGRRATVDKAAVSRSVRQLMQKKLIKRLLHNDAGPILQVMLTPAGQTTFACIAGELKALQDRLLQGLDTRRRAALFDALLVIEDNLREVQNLPARQA